MKLTLHMSLLLFVAAMIKWQMQELKNMEGGTFRNSEITL